MLRHKVWVFLTLWNSNPRAESFLTAVALSSQHRASHLHYHARQMCHQSRWWPRGGISLTHSMPYETMQMSWRRSCDFASLATSMPGAWTCHWLCTASSHIHAVLQPWRGSSPALLEALVVTAALHGSMLSLFHVFCDSPAPQAVLVCSQPSAISAMKRVLPALADDISWFLRLTGRFASLRWLTGPYLQLTRWSPDLDTCIFVLRGWASKGNV